MTTAVLINHVAAYAAAVRRHLGDLSPEQVEDLTDGLEADLAEALEDPTRPVTGEIPVPLRTTVPAGEAVTQKLSTGTTPVPAAEVDLTARFGTPEAYAEELRSAAGIPPALPAGGRPRRRSLFAALADRAAPMTAAVTAHRSWPAVRDFFVSLRPFWWVARGWALFTAAAVVFGRSVELVPSSLGAFVVLLLLVVVSVQHGRGLLTPPSRFAGVVTALNVLAVVSLLFAAPSAGDAGPQEADVYYTDEVAVADGVYLDGEPLRNLFVYGPDGTAVDGARIVDDRLRPVVLGGPDGLYDAELDTMVVWEAREDVQGREVWNAYPLATSTGDLRWDEGSDRWVSAEGTDPVRPVPPVATLAPLAPAPDAPTAPVDPAVP